MEKQKIGEMAEKAGQECCGGTSCSTNIREHMDVIASCGKKVGVVDRVEGDSIKLTKKDSPDGKHHLIPTSWVARVDTHVHLNKKNSQEFAEELQAQPVCV